MYNQSFIFNKVISEHFNGVVSGFDDVGPITILFNKELKRKNNETLSCFEIKQESGSLKAYCNYFIGTDWIDRKNNLAVQIAPKLNDDINQIDYMKILQECFKNPDVYLFNEDLFEVKLEDPFIIVKRQFDYLTPLLVFQFLQLLKKIVKRGLKKSYYRIERNLSGKIKGKVIVSKQIKFNHFKNKTAVTFCEFDEFGVNCIENRVLKLTLVFIQRYMLSCPGLLNDVNSIINYCLPSFSMVNCDVDLERIKGVHHNPFYKDYKHAFEIANLLLKRFNYNIKDVDKVSDELIKVPPFWINMPKLFELYVLGMLKERYKGLVAFQVGGHKRQKVDFLLVKDDLKLIIDAKYRNAYVKDKYEIDDIRQLSGYARDLRILEKLGIDTSFSPQPVNCLIVFADLESHNLKLPDDLLESPIADFLNFFKCGIKLPVKTMDL